MSCKNLVYAAYPRAESGCHLRLKDKCPGYKDQARGILILWLPWHSDRERKQVNEAAPQSNDICSRCGLRKSQVGSFTFWIFKEDRCQCEVSEKPETKILDNRYELIECVGQGAIGKVYKARDLTREDEIVALKVMRPELAANQLAVQRLIREVQVASKLSNSNLGQVYGYGQEKDGQPYLVMEFVAGPDLGYIIKSERQLEAGRALELFLQICSGLDCAHLNGTIHRDLKPSNVIVQTMKNGRERAVIVDFGFATLLQEADSTRLTREGEAFGSPAYMSPEQCLGEQLDHRSDIYSFGCLMYEALTGVPPLLGENVLATVAKQVREMPVSMRDHDPQIPAEFDAIVMKCLAKEPILRYQTASDLRVDLDKVRHGVFKTSKSTTKPKTSKSANSSKTLRTAAGLNYLDMKTLIAIIVAVSIIVGTVTGVVVWLLLPQRTETKPTTTGVTVETPTAKVGTPTAPQAAPTTSQAKPPDSVAKPKKVSSQNERAKQKPRSETTTSSKRKSVSKPATDAPRRSAVSKQNVETAPVSSGWQQLRQLREHK